MLRGLRWVDARLIDGEDWLKGGSNEYSDHELLSIRFILSEVNSICLCFESKSRWCTESQKVQWKTDDWRRFCENVGRAMKKLLIVYIGQKIKRLLI